MFLTETYGFTQDKNLLDVQFMINCFQNLGVWKDTNADSHWTEAILSLLFSESGSLKLGLSYVLLQENLFLFFQKKKELSFEAVA